MRTREGCCEVGVVCGLDGRWGMVSGVEAHLKGDGGSVEIDGVWCEEGVWGFGPSATCRFARELGGLLIKYIKTDIEAKFRWERAIAPSSI